MKYAQMNITFQDLPDEISLTIAVTGCPRNCEGCHWKPWGWNNPNHGKDLTFDAIDRFIKRNTIMHEGIRKGITNILFYGGEWEKDNLIGLVKKIRMHYPYFKISLFTGATKQELTTKLKDLISYFDYIKYGPYIKKLGDLTNPNTNQRLYKVVEGDLGEDITYKYWNIKTKKAMF